MKTALSFFVFCLLTLHSLFSFAEVPATTNPSNAKEPIVDICRRSICAVYSTSAKGKIAYECGLKKYKGNCYCTKTDRVCAKNWRGKAKYTHECHCRPICEQTICAVYTKTAQTKASYACGWKAGYRLGNCKCKQTTSCGKNWRGKHKYNYQCKCK